MSEHRVSSAQAVDAVSKTLDLNAESHERHEAKTSSNAEDGESTQDEEHHKKALSYLIFSLFEKFQSALHLDGDKKEKLKRFAASNIGITIIVLLVVFICIGINMVRHHHAHSVVQSNASAWIAPVASVSHSTHSKPVILKDNRISQALNDSTIDDGNKNSLEIKKLMTTVNGLKTQIKNLNQRLMVVSVQLNRSTLPHQAASHYRVLGWRLDDNSDQWLADIEYDGQVKAYYSGQHFGKWQVKTVTADGVKIV